MSLDQELRTVLRQRADMHAARSDLLTAVARRGNRRRQRRRAVASICAVVVVAVAVPVAMSLRPEPAAEVAAVALVASGSAPTFPLTPGWEPEWVGLRSFGYLRAATGVEAVLRYEPTFPFAAELSVAVGERDPGITGEAVEVGDRAATLATTNAGAVLAWRIPGGWVRVAANNRVSRDDLLHYAASLAERPLPMALPFAVAVVPEGATLNSFDRRSQVYRRVGTPDVDLTITLVPSAAMTSQQSTVDDQSIALAYRRVDSDRTVRIAVSKGWNLSTEQLAEIAGGVTATSLALTSGG